MSRFEQGQTPLHFAMSRKRYDILDLLIELGADLEAEDMNGQTALAVAMLRGDREAMSRLHAAGREAAADDRAVELHAASMASMAGSVKKGVPMITCPGRRPDPRLVCVDRIQGNRAVRRRRRGELRHGVVRKAELMLNMHGKPGPHDVSLWFYTDQVDGLYQLLKSRQLEAAQAALAGEPGDHEGIEFEQDIEDMFYGARQFCIRDPNG